MSYKPVDTAIVMVVGPCIDDTDFKTLEESIAYDAAGMDVSLIIEKTDGTTAVTAITLTTGGTSDWTHKDGGYYEIEVTAAQNIEEGVGYIRGVCTGVLPFESPRYDIVKANIYDSWIKGTDALQVDAIEISGDSTAADNLELDYDGTGYAKANSTIGTCTTNTDMRGTDSAALAATALSNITWTDAKAAFIDHSIATVDTNVDTLLTRVTAAVALASVCTETRLAELDSANIPTDIADIPTVAEFEARTVSSTAAANIEDTFDGTGYTNDSAPSTQEQVGRLTSGSAAINTTAESFTKAGAEPETNTYTATVSLDGTFHIVEDDATATDCYYQFDVGGNGVPVSVTWQGYAQSNGDSYSIWAYNYGTTSYEQIGTITAVNGTTVVENTFSLTNAHVGTGANIGKVRFRFLSADGTAFATDRILCAYAIVTKSTGYSDGAIWINTNGSNTNTEDYVDGTADNPVSTWAAAKTLSTSLGIKKFSIVNGSIITLDTNSDNFTFEGNEWTLALGGQSIVNIHVEEATVTGIGTGAGAHFDVCRIGTSTLAKATFTSCGFSGTLTVSAADTYIFDKCYNGADGSVAPVLDFGAATGNTHCAFRDWQGGIEVANLGQAGTDVFSVTGRGKVIIASTCSAGTIKVFGDFMITDNVVAGFSGTLIEDSRYDVAQINAECDTALLDIKLDHLVAVADSDDVVDDSIIAKMTAKGATADWSTFVNTTDSLEAVRDRGDTAWITGAGGTPPTTLQSTTIATLATQTSFTLTAGSSDDDAYNNCIVIVEDSVATAQKCIGRILNYTGATKTITLEADPNVFTMAVGDTIDIIAVEKVWVAATKEVDTITGNVDGNVGGNVTGSVGSLSAAAIDSILDEIIGDAVHATPNSVGAMLHAVYCRYMQKREADATSETSYKLDDTTPLKTFTLSSVAGTVTRT